MHWARQWGVRLLIIKHKETDGGEVPFSLRLRTLLVHVAEGEHAVGAELEDEGGAFVGAHGYGSAERREPRDLLELVGAQRNLSVL